MTGESKIEKLYMVSTNCIKSEQPKRSLLSLKCPKCDTKLDKESVEERIFVGKGGTEFANKVGTDAELTLGVYNLHIDHFVCKNCSYEFAKAQTRLLEDT
jgi:hypothetical protein